MVFGKRVPELIDVDASRVDLPAERVFVEDRGQVLDVRLGKMHARLVDTGAHHSLQLVLRQFTVACKDLSFYTTEKLGMICLIHLPPWMSVEVFQTPAGMFGETEIFWVLIGRVFAG